MGASAGALGIERQDASPVNGKRPAPIFLTPAEALVRFGRIQAGPCLGCGATSYSLSTGGPGICPACDCIPPERRVGQLAEENRALRQRVAELEAMLSALSLPPVKSS